MLKKVMIIFIMLVFCLGLFVGISKATEVLNEDIGGEEIVASNDTAVISDSNKGIGLIAAALAIGLSAIGSGIAVAVVASSAVGAISENPSLLGKTVIFAGLAEGIAIYGLIIAIMILSKI